MRAFSFEAKRRGAARVLAAYSWVWKDPKLNARDLGAGAQPPWYRDRVVIYILCGNIDAASRGFGAMDLARNRRIYWLPIWNMPPGFASSFGLISGAENVESI